MDAMRSILMMLGVVVHACNVFHPDKAWLIYSEQTTVLAKHVAYWIHAFRMPAFFIVSGYFCVYTIGKYNPAKFLKVRLTRIAVPLLATAILLNSLQALLLVYTGYRHYRLAGYLLNGRWVGHLWFLVNLIIYFLAAGALARYFANPAKIAGNFLSKLFMATPLTLILAGMPLATVAVLGLNQMGFPLYSSFGGVIETRSLLRYLPFFAFGCLMGGNNHLLNKFVRIKPIVASPALIGAVVLMNYYSEQNSITQKFLFTYMEALVTWLAVIICFYAFYRLCNTPSKTWLFLSDASYTVYLFHHIFVIGIGYLMIRLKMPVLPSLVLLIVTTFVITLCIHKYWILKSKSARFLFNGKQLPATTMAISS
jgi:glucan biosynthesis protein C